MAVVEETTMSEISKGITLTVTVKHDRKYKIRFWIALQLFELAGYISPFEFELKTDRGA
jgi:hypothetical protein